MREWEENKYDEGKTWSLPLLVWWDCGTEKGERGRARRSDTGFSSLHLVLGGSIWGGGVASGKAWESPRISRFTAYFPWRRGQGEVAKPQKKLYTHDSDTWGGGVWWWEGGSRWQVVEYSSYSEPHGLYLVCEKARWLCAPVIRCGSAKSPYQWIAVPWGKKLPKAEERGISKPGPSLQEGRLQGGSSTDCKRRDGGGPSIACPVNTNWSFWSEPRTMSPSHYENPARPFPHADAWERRRGGGKICHYLHRSSSYQRGTLCYVK